MTTCPPAVCCDLPGAALRHTARIFTPQPRHNPVNHPHLPRPLAGTSSPTHATRTHTHHLPPHHPPPPGPPSSAADACLRRLLDRPPAQRRACSRLSPPSLASDTSGPGGPEGCCDVHAGAGMRVWGGSGVCLGQRGRPGQPEDAAVRTRGSRRARALGVGLVEVTGAPVCFGQSGRLKEPRGRGYQRSARCKHPGKRAPWRITPCGQAQGAPLFGSQQRSAQGWVQQQAAAGRRPRTLADGLRPPPAPLPPPRPAP